MVVRYFLVASRLRKTGLLRKETVKGSLRHHHEKEHFCIQPATRAPNNRCRSVRTNLPLSIRSSCVRASRHNSLYAGGPLQRLRKRSAALA